MALPLPDERTRWRCSRCGNLTRFDVTRSARTLEYWHLDLAGDHRVEETRQLAETVEKVTCRWCGADDAVELVPRPDTADDPTGLGGP